MILAARKDNSRQLLDEWELYADSVINSTPVDNSETPKQKAARIKRLEADGNAEEWIEYYFPNGAKPAAFHRAATRRITKNMEWYEVRKWSRELAKSTRTMYENLYLMLTLRKRYTLLISNSFENAKRLLQPYKIHLEVNPRLCADYGKQERAGSWTDSEFTARNGGAWRALGAGQSPRGTRNKDIRPDFIIFDDIDTDEDCRNPETVKNTWKWIEEAAIGTRSISNALTVIFCGNRIAVDCCVERACKYADHVDEINIRDKNGRSTWPEKNSEEQITRVLSQKSYASAQKEYFNNPIVEGSVFKAMGYKPARPIKDYSLLVCYTDPSFKDSRKNDFKATVLVGKWKDEYHVIKAYLEQTNTATMIDWHYHIMDIVGAHACYFLMEQVFLSELIIKEFYETSRSKGRTIPIAGDIRQKDDKFTRIESLLEPLHRNGKLYLNEAEKENPHMQRLDEQFVALAPGSRAHDDGPDAVEGAVFVINNKLAARTHQPTLICRSQNSKRF